MQKGVRFEGRPSRNRNDPSAVEAAIDKLRQHTESEGGFMRVSGLQRSDRSRSEHALIVTHAFTLDAADRRCLLPMSEAACAALSKPTTLNVVTGGVPARIWTDNRAPSVDTRLLVPALAWLDEAKDCARAHPTPAGRSKTVAMSGCADR